MKNWKYNKYRKKHYADNSRRILRKPKKKSKSKKKRAGGSGVEWTNRSYVPWYGCSKVSPACERCFAEFESSTRYKRVEGWGPKQARVRPSEKSLNRPRQWNRQAMQNGRRELVFCSPWSDVFDDHPSIQSEWRADLWKKIRETPNLIWLLVTKRPENFERFLPEDWSDGYPNVCLMVTVENQEFAEKRIPVLLDTPAAFRALSVEPLLGPVDLAQYIHGLHWVIAGGETLSGARPTNPNWLREIRDLCAAHEVPFFFKQWGWWTPEILPNAKEIHEFEDGEVVYFRGNKKMNGNLLYGERHLEDPFSREIEG